MKLRLLIRLVVLFGVVAPALAWAVVKPVRVVAPTWAGVVCVDDVLCTDEPPQAEAARALYRDAVAHLEAQLGPLGGAPRVVFCASQACADAFGLGARSAVTFATWGTVIGPHAWQPHYVKHELIHYAQGRHVGVVRLLFKPAWFVEGMAYALSEDPRPVLGEPFEAHRKKFLAWHAWIDRSRLWAEAGKL
jgi:hypothetical protein